MSSRDWDPDTDWMLQRDADLDPDEPEDEVQSELALRIADNVRLTAALRAAGAMAKAIAAMRTPDGRLVHPCPQQEMWNALEAYRAALVSLPEVKA
jgi:hypothetical protein